MVTNATQINRVTKVNEVTAAHHNKVTQVAWVKQFIISG